MAYITARGPISRTLACVPRPMWCFLLVADAGGLVLCGTLAWHTRAVLPAVLILVGYALLGGGLGAAIGWLSMTLVRVQDTADRLLASVDAITHLEQIRLDPRPEVETARIASRQPTEIM